MKYITLIIGLLVVGCEKGGEITIGEPPKTKPVKELTAEEKKVVGTYEMKEVVDTIKYVFLENGVLEAYRNGKKHEGKFKWKISKDGEIYFIDEHEDIGGVSRINKDGSITYIASIVDGKRTDFTKEEQYTYKKIK